MISDGRRSARVHEGMRSGAIRSASSRDGHRRRNEMARIYCRGPASCAPFAIAWLVTGCTTHDVLGGDIGWIDNIVPAKRSVRLPVVLTPNEVRAVLGHLKGTSWLMASLMYGTGLRLMECCRVRVKDVDFERGEIIVRDGKGRKDRVTMLPDSLKEALRVHLVSVREQHTRDLTAGTGVVALPGALERKYPATAREWRWHWVFPAARFYADRETGELKRHHRHESVLQRDVKDATRKVLGHRDVTTTMIYTHVLNRGGLGVKSPLDR